MRPVLETMWLLAQDSPGPSGRGDNPEEGGGIAIILGIALFVLLALVAAVFILGGRRRRGSSPD